MINSVYDERKIIQKKAVRSTVQDTRTIIIQKFAGCSQKNTFLKFVIHKKNAVDLQGAEKKNYQSATFVEFAHNLLTSNDFQISIWHE